MLARAASRAFSSSGLRAAEAAAKPAAAAVHSELILNFAVPSKPLVYGKAVKRVTLPGRDGAFGLEKNSPPLLSELKPGVVRVDYEDNTVEEHFIPGGFAFKHPNNVVDVSSPEALKLDQVDADALKAANAEAVKAKDAATPGSKAHVEAQLALEVYRVLSQVAKVQL
jgi:F-type H+-transporting ATPase subunit epsilon